MVSNQLAGLHLQEVKANNNYKNKGANCCVFVAEVAGVQSCCFGILVVKITF